jgi:mutator protein MutT
VLHEIGVQRHATPGLDDEASEGEVGPFLGTDEDLHLGIPSSCDPRALVVVDLSDRHDLSMMNEDSKPNLSPDGVEGNARDVVACVVSDERGRVLIGRRPAHKRHGGLWEFPGGKVRPGETLAEAADRELQEELAVRVVRAEPRPEFVAVDRGSEFRILFLRVGVEGVPHALEHEALTWYDPHGDSEFDFAPADAAFVRALRL